MLSCDLFFIRVIRVIRGSAFLRSSWRLCVLARNLFFLHPEPPVPAPFLEARAIDKGFPGVQALACVSMHVGVGEVLAVVGENGAGKSTLMKVVAGVYRPDGGELFLRGEPVQFSG